MWQPRLRALLPTRNGNSHANTVALQVGAFVRPLSGPWTHRLSSKHSGWAASTPQCGAACRHHIPLAHHPSLTNQQVARSPAGVHATALVELTEEPRVIAPLFTAGRTAPAMTLTLPQLISKEQVQALEAELDEGASIAALRRFNENLRSVTAERWEAVLTPVFVELCYNLESFNPAFTSCLLMVQRTIGMTDYGRRDLALKHLIQPLAGEYGMHIVKTHRELFADFFASLFGYPLEELMARGTPAPAAQTMWRQMSRDITTGGSGVYNDPVSQASYALGYNLAIEYLADYEKTWMLDSFRDLDARVLSGLGKKIDWVFLEVHAEGEAEHAAIGHNAVISLVPEDHMPILRRAMQDHNRDFAAFYNHVADLLERR